MARNIAYTCILYTFLCASVSKYEQTLDEQFVGFDCPGIPLPHSRERSRMHSVYLLSFFALRLRWLKRYDLLSIPHSSQIPQT